MFRSWNLVCGGIFAFWIRMDFFDFKFRLERCHLVIPVFKLPRTPIVKPTLQLWRIITFWRWRLRSSTSGFETYLTRAYQKYIIRLLLWRLNRPHYTASTDAFSNLICHRSTWNDLILPVDTPIMTKPSSAHLFEVLYPIVRRSFYNLLIYRFTYGLTDVLRIQLHVWKL